MLINLVNFEGNPALDLLACWNHKKVSILINTIFYRALIFFAFACVVVQQVSAQRKKKTPDVQPSTTKNREAEFYFTEAEKYFILEDYAKAMLYYQKSLEIAPESPTVHYKMATVLSQNNKPEELQKASLSIENALKYEKKNKYFYLLAASIYNGLGKFDKSIAAYETMLAEVKGAEEYLYDLAVVYQYADKPEEAIKAYNRAESVFGVNEMSSIQKIRLYFEAGKNKDGIAEGEKLMAAFPEEAKFVVGFAEVLTQRGQTPLAISYLEKFIQDQDDTGNVKLLLAGLYRDANQEQKARNLLRSIFDDPSVELNSKILVLGSYNTELNQHKDHPDSSKQAFALMLFSKLLNAYPDDVNVHIVGGDLYMTSGQDRLAVAEYLKAISLGSTNYEVWQNLIYLETRLELFDKVIEHAEEALETFPNQGMLYYFNGLAHLRKRTFREAIVSLEQAKKLSASNTPLLQEINSMLGDSYHSTRQYVESDKAYEEVLAINPDNSIVLNNYSYYLALRKENLEKAEKMSAQLIKSHPDNPTFLDTYAWVLYSREKYKEARKVMEKAISTGKANATHFEHYGDILFKMGDVEGAVAQWEKARGMDAKNDILNKKIANRKIYE